jgi:hypothetical protein
MKKLFNKIITYIQKLNKKDFEKNLIFFLAIIAMFSFGGIYFIYTEKEDLINKIKTTKRLVLKTTNIIKKYEKMQQEEDILQKLLEQETDFNIKTYFEQFCTQQQITPEGNWEAITQELPGSDKFDESVISATFNNQTTKKLIDILQALNEKDIVYIKELIIKSEDNKKINFDITIATKKFKRSI